MKFSITALSVLIIATPLLKAGTPVTMDFQNSSIVAHAKATGHGFEATPKIYTCDLEIDNDRKAIEKVTFSFRFENLTTQNAKRDKEMLHWLEAETFPELIFTANQWSMEGGQNVLRGELTFHGKTQPIAIVMELQAQDGFHAKGYFRIDTRDFGLAPIKKMMFLKVDPLLQINLDLNGSLAAHQTAGNLQ